MKTKSQNDIVGHKTFRSGKGLLFFRHEPLTRKEAEIIMQEADKAKKDRAKEMPDEKTAIEKLFNAWLRLKELGWREGTYCPKDGTHFKEIQLGSTGIFDCICEGEWPDCTWTTFDEYDSYPSSQAPALFRLYPKDQAIYDLKMKEIKDSFQTEPEKEKE